ncbi:MAG TPA: sprT domain-containing protein, partial [Bacteroidetes bacterium]|nr:sprT domain-containing protein [Bacteroidota bacterium]
MDLKKAEKLANSLIKQHIVDYYILSWKFKFDRSKSRFGCCSHKYRTI